jgi:hypothetical protein
MGFYKGYFVQYLTRCALIVVSLPIFAQLPVSPAAAPVPPAIKSAKTLFISNGGADSGLFPSPFSGTSDRPYSEFYVNLASDRAHQLVSDPSEADLVLELRLLAPAGPQRPNKQNGASDPLPMLRLIIYDRKTHYVLWTLSESVEFALLQKTHDRNLDDAVRAIAADFRELTRKIAGA